VELVLPDTSKQDLAAVINFLYTGQVTIQADRMEAIASLALSLGLPTLVSAVSRILCRPHASQTPPKKPSPASSPHLPYRRPSSPSPPPSPPVSPPSLKRPASPQQGMPSQRPRMTPNPIFSPSSSRQRWPTGRICPQSQFSSQRLIPMCTHLSLQQSSQLLPN